MPPRRAYRLAQVVVLLAGLGYTLVGLALLFAPVWFFQHIGMYPPYNRHYEGDLGTAMLPVGVSLLVAATAPRRYLPLLWLGTAISVLHAANHAVEVVAHGVSELGTAGSLAVFAVALGLATAYVSSQPKGDVAA
ncbi:MAG TPA: hypothetical protein VF807_13740 [Ktedonobacterales bacterium]